MHEENAVLQQLSTLLSDSMFQLFADDPLGVRPVASRACWLSPVEKNSDVHELQRGLNCILIAVCSLGEPGEHPSLACCNYPLQQAWFQSLPFLRKCDLEIVTLKFRLSSARSLGCTYEFLVCLDHGADDVWTFPVKMSASSANSLQVCRRSLTNTTWSTNPQHLWTWGLRRFPCSFSLLGGVATTSEWFAQRKFHFWSLFQALCEPLHNFTIVRTPVSRMILHAGENSNREYIIHTYRCNRKATVTSLWVLSNEGRNITQKKMKSASYTKSTYIFFTIEKNLLNAPNTTRMIFCLTFSQNRTFQSRTWYCTSEHEGKGPAP